MADRKISELPELTTASGDDLVPVVDVSANETKKIGVDEFFQSSTLLATTGTTASNALSLAQGNQTSITSQQTSINSLDTRLTTQESLQTSAGNSISNLGTASVEDVGTSAGNVVQLDSSGKIPALDGSQLTNIQLILP